eukprot:12146383-Alexandrium_andersonii.AAC.1
MASSPTVHARSVELPAALGAGSPQASRAPELPQKLGPCSHSRSVSAAACEPSPASTPAWTCARPWPLL